MDWLADILLDNYRQRFNDPGYVVGKQKDLEDLDRLGAMRAIGGLDDAGRAMLCQKLKIERTDLEAFLRVLREL